MNKTFSIIIVIGCCISFYIIASNIHRYSARLAVCPGKNVQAVYIRLREGNDVLIYIKGSPKLVERCLNKELPYFDRSVELLIDLSKQTRSQKKRFTSFSINKMYSKLRVGDEVHIEKMRIIPKNSFILLRLYNSVFVFQTAQTLSLSDTKTVKRLPSPLFIGPITPRETKPSIDEVYF